jgi:UDP-N-acetylmuramate: L-alanyl-gamma-D-glutamyl-meso-diaminopimelate ligase
MKSKEKKETIHLIGVGGSAIAPLAVMLQKEGYTITGSDANVFEPALSLLNKNKIDWYEGAKPEKIKDADLVIIGGSMLMKDKDNPEYIEAKKLKKRIESFTYLVKEHIIKENSIVITGTYGKTTITSLIAWILESANLNPSFLIGGLPLNFDYGIRKTDSNYSVVEGDEFAASFGFDMTPKFMYYEPKYTVITATQWDHVNMYTTEKEYIDAFKELVELTNGNKGNLLISTDGKNNQEVAEVSNNVQYYGLKKGDFTVENLKFNEDKTTFFVNKGDDRIGEFETTLLGIHNVENCLAAISLLHNIGIDSETIKDGLKTYKGVKRRLEIIGKNSKGATIIDDFAHSPVKAQSTLEALRTRFKEKKILAIYSPRVSERESKATLSWYKNTFDAANSIIIPKITVKKTTKKEERIHGIDIINAIEKDETEKHYFPKEEQILEFLENNSDRDTIIIFMSAGGWGDLMEKAVKV